MKPSRKLPRLAIGIGVGLSLLVFGAPLVGTAAAAHVGCGTAIITSTTLDSDVGPCDGDGIIIGADNITLNLNGHQVLGQPGVGDGSTAGIRLPQRTGVTITSGRGPERTGTVRDFDAGVFINGGSGNSVGNLTLRDNISRGGEATLGDGITLFHSGHNRIINNLVAHNGPFDGVGVLGVDSNNNLIRGNTIEETVSDELRPDGFTLGVGTGTGILINNFLDEQGTPRRGEPIRRNDIIDNIVRLNDNSGISNITNIGARIRGNTVEGNGRLGEQCFLDRIGNELCTPVATPSNGIGVTVGPATSNVTRLLISDNTVANNTGNGIEVNTRENRIVGNATPGNGGSGAGDVNVFDGVAFAAPGGRFDLFDSNTSQALCEGPTCRTVPSCDQNIWHQNAFETAFPECAEETGLTPPPIPPPDPTCSDGIDNDGDGFTDREDFDCGGPPPPFPGDPNQPPDLNPEPGPPGTP